MSKYIGLNDKDGMPIHVGDNVTFYFDEFLGYSKVPHPDYTTMNDVVIEEGKEFYFLNPDIGSAAFAWRHNEHCTVARSGQ